MLVELHSHTYHSRGTKIFYDAVDSPVTMVRTAAKKGLGAIAITDHNIIKGALEARKHAKKHDILVIVGEEITTTNGHLLGIGIEDKIKPGMGVSETVDAIHDQGGIAVAPHPFDIKHDGIGVDCTKCDAVEVFNSINLERIANMRCLKFAQKRKLCVTAGSDAHSSVMIGNALNVTKAHDIDGILKAVRKGKNEIITKYASAASIMDLIMKRLQMSYVHTSSYIDKNYHGPKKIVSKNLLGLVQKSPGNIDYLFRGMFYFSLGNVILYSALRSMFDKT